MFCGGGEGSGGVSDRERSSLKRFKKAWVWIMKEEADKVIRLRAANYLPKKPQQKENLNPCLQGLFFLAVES